MVLFLAHHPYYDFGILETNVGNSKRSAARLSFFNRGQFPKRPGSGFVCGICSLLPAGHPLASQDKLPADKSDENISRIDNHRTRITPRTPRSSTIMPMRWTARIIPNVHSIYPYNKKLHAEAKSAECEIFYHPKKPKKMFCPEDIAKDTTRYGFSGS